MVAEHNNGSGAPFINTFSETEAKMAVVLKTYFQIPRYQFSRRLETPISVMDLGKSLVAIYV